MENKEAAGTQTGSLMPALLGGLVAAVIGGSIWGAIAVWTGGYEVGYVAWAVGLICGFGVVMLSGGKRGSKFQMIAVGASMLGILIGKYVIVHNIVTTVITQKQGAEAARAISMFSMEMVAFFGKNIESVASGFDMVWIALAVITAWSIPKASGLKIANS